MEIHEEKILLAFSFEGPKHVTFGRAYMLWDLTGPARTHHDEPKSQRSPCSGAPATTRHRVTIQNGHRTTHTPTPTFKNAARTTTKHHIPIQNDHRATRTHTHTHQASKCSRRHNETPRYDSKWPPRHTETLDHNVALAV